jgi:hypothetical protein
MKRARTAELAALYRGLPAPARCALWGLVVAEAVLIAAAERDIQRRPASEIRGPKLLWRAIATQNVIGPAAYFKLARRPGRRVAT